MAFESVEELIRAARNGRSQKEFADLLEVERSGPPFVGHQSREHNLLVGFDAAF